MEFCYKKLDVKFQNSRTTFEYGVQHSVGAGVSFLIFLPVLMILCDLGANSKSQKARTFLLGKKETCEGREREKMLLVVDM